MKNKHKDQEMRFFAETEDYSRNMIKVFDVLNKYMPDLIPGHW